MSPTITLVYYTHNVIPDRLRDAVLRRLDVVAENMRADKMAVVANFIRMPGSGWRQEFKARGFAGDGAGLDQDSRIVHGCTHATTDLVALVEHDVLYPETYLQGAPLDEIAAGHWWYDVNVMRVNRHGYFTGSEIVTSCMIAPREQVAEHFGRRVSYRRAGNRIVWDEPGKDLESIHGLRRYVGLRPVLDVRWGGNMTGMREARGGYYRTTIEGWPEHSELWREVMQ